MEPCIYLEMKNYDVEISGGYTENKKINIYVWNKAEQKIVDRHLDIENNFEVVKNILDKIKEKYQSL